MDLLLHNRCLLLDDIFGFTGLFLDEATVLALELTDEFLDLAFLLSLVALICHKAFDNIGKSCLDNRVFAAFLSSRRSLLKLSLVEIPVRVVKIRLILRLSMSLDDHVNSLLQILPSKHDVLKIRQSNRNQSH